MKLYFAALAPAVLFASAVAFAQQPAVEPDVLTALMERGGEVYARDCQSCHGNAGQGGAGLPLAGTGFIESTERTVKQITQGNGFMPGFPTLSDADVAAVATYIRNSFGNEFGPVTEEEAKTYR